MEFARAIGYLTRNWGSPFIIAFILLLVASAAELLTGSANAQSVANSWAVYAFCSLVLGVALQIGSYLKYGEGVTAEKKLIPRMPRLGLGARAVAVLVVAALIGGSAYVYFYLPGTSLAAVYPSETTRTDTSILTSVSTSTSTTVIVSTLSGGVTTTVTSTTVFSSTSTFTTVVTTLPPVPGACANSFFLDSSAPTPITVQVTVQNQVYQVYSGVGGGVNLCFELGVISFSAPGKVGNYTFSAWGVVGVPSVGGGNLTWIKSNAISLNLQAGLQVRSAAIFVTYAIS
jgi:hypothetical protein